MENNDLISTASNIINVNEETFMSEVVEVSKTKPVIVDFWAPWCEPCKTLTPLLEDAVKGYGQELILAKIDIDQNQNIAAQLRIQSIPTIYTFFEGKVVDGFQGAKSNSEIIEFVKKSASLTGPGQEVEDLILNAKEMLDGLPEHKDEWLGFRPTLPDFLPVIGPSKNYENVYYSFGHHHLGWTLGAISGKIVSGMIANENTNMDLKPYSSVRFA